ncbi:hypothetical protein DENSPDRAFT_418424 [Dentipellis sp. KUC8613]|nr:hypothetical protein DENSPDRAFT_418424 [Dentipellis sp. KUC8613]
MNRCYTLPFPAEFELDSEGNRIPDPDFGFRLTAQSLENRRKWHDAFFKGRDPMEALPSEYRVSSRRPAYTLPRLVFGFAIQCHHIFGYAERRRIKVLDEAKSEPIYRRSHAALSVLADLDRRCGADLSYEFPRWDDCDLMICLYTNLTLAQDQLEPQEEKEVIEILQRELQISEPPKWYWDGTNTANS